MSQPQLSNDAAVGIVGDQPEAVLLSAMFAEKEVQNYLVGPFQPLEQRPISRNALDEALWLLSIHTKNGTIKLLGDVRDLPLTRTNNLFLTGHALSQQDTSHHEKIVRSIAQTVQKNSNFVFAGLSRPGYTTSLGEMLRKYSGMEAGRDIGLCHLPLLWNGETVQEFQETPRIVAGIGKEAVSKLQETLLTIFPSISTTNRISVAEAAGLFNPIYRDVLSALQLELANFCSEEGVDYFEALSLCKGPKLGLEAPRAAPARDFIGSEIALSSTRRIPGPRMIRTARRMNQQAPRQVMNLVKGALNLCGRRFRRSRIAILGLEGLGGRTRTNHETPEIIHSLRRRGALLSVYPGRDSEWAASGFASAQVTVVKSVVKAVEDAQCALIALEKSDANELNPQKLAAGMSLPAAICDLTRVLDASNVERAGLLYASIGRASSGSPLNLAYSTALQHESTG